MSIGGGPVSRPKTSSALVSTTEPPRRFRHRDLVRDGLRMILDSQDDIEVVADGQAAARETLLRRPDVALLDVHRSLRPSAPNPQAAPGSLNRR
ncbi:MAG TPA: hypothetical protein VFR67_27325 [Pilimelia sp.]|nr:hypothetical protein [Pilimelia sp.]